MIKAIKDFPLYDDNKQLKYYKIGDTVEVNKALSEKLILCGKCEIYDPRKKADEVETKVVDSYETQADTPPKKKKKRK